MSLMALITGVIAAAQAKDLLNSFYPSFGIAYQRKMMSTWPTNIPSINELVEMFYKKQLDPVEFNKYCNENGINTEISLKFLETAKVIIPATDAVMLWRRGEITEAQRHDIIEKLHISSETEQQIIKASEYYPTAQDLIVMAVREVFTPEIAAAYGQFEDFPPQFITEAAKIGLTEKQAKNYWAAHWELPSATQGYEMLHRGVISYEQLKTLLRAKDYMPFWREPLINIAYNVVTRVDTRRLYRTGIYDADKVYKTYLAMGYNQEDAQALTQFTIEDAVHEKTDPTKATLDKAFKDDLITLEQYQAYLKQMKYTDEPIQLYTDEVMYAKKMEAVKEIIDEMKSQYLLGIITIDTVTNVLNGMDLPANYVTNQVNKIKLALASKVKMPDKNDLITWLTKGVIDAEGFNTKMLEIGYRNEDIGLYIAQVQGSKK
jgi:hypothetical protein